MFYGDLEWFVGQLIMQSCYTGVRDEKSRSEDE